MAALNGYITPVSFDVPPAKMPEALMDKASELCIKFRLWQVNRADNKAQRNRRLLAIAEGRAQPEYYVDEYRDRRTRRAQRRARRGRTGKPARKLRGQVAKADRLELNATSDLVWVVIMNADQGQIEELFIDSEQFTDLVVLQIKKLKGGSWLTIWRTSKLVRFFGIIS